MSSLFVGICVCCLLLLRWVHLYWARGHGHSILKTKDTWNCDWPASALGLLYVAALILCFVGLWKNEEIALSRGSGALLLMAAGVGLRVAGQSSLRGAFSWYWAPPESLVTTGIYKWIKHPLLIGYFLEVASLLLASSTSSWLVATLAGLCALLLYFQGVGEEKRLLTKFGEEWRTFARGKMA